MPGWLILSGEDYEPQLSPFDSRLYRSRYRNGRLLNTRAVGKHQQELEREHQASQPKATADTQPAKTSQPGTGSIEVSSTPSGARVLLVAVDEGGAGEPQPRGVTPTTITGVYPGTYTVDLEKPGYRFFQKNVVVQANSTAKVNAALRRQ
jgi:hypothetical protein